MRESSRLDALGNIAQQLASNRPTAWEHRLLIQIVLDDLDRLKPLRREHEIGLAFGEASYVSLSSLGEWHGRRLHELRSITEGLAALFESPLDDALGPPGEPGVPEKIEFIGKRIGQAYEEALLWTQRVRRTAAPEELRPVLIEMARLADGIIHNIEHWATHGQAQLEAALAQPPASDPINVDLTLRIAVGGDPEKITQLLDELSVTAR